MYARTVGRRNCFSACTEPANCSALVEARTDCPIPKSPDTRDFYRSACACPKLQVHPVYSVIAEKYQAMLLRGQANSRMKDFFEPAGIA
ncbi:nucleotidyl transferase AbiEii/AbiGii toxin family protein [Roseateles sp.]|uniref:nucleotidyl transferase AbiEii/AbiGii toxin family protein n=1 Tax=Roseateles sp. TaxID=1971397 RepID=UPI003D1173FC